MASGKKPLETGSGSVLADRRADYAEMLFADGEFSAAAELLLGAMELAPRWAFGWFRLGEMHEAAGERAAAVRAWRMAQDLDPADRAGAALKLALAGGSAVPEHPPSAFVETLFDQYAKNFDHALVDVLGYQAPELLFDALNRVHPGRFNHAVDLGCGTGLMGEKLRPIADHLAGYDISAAMLAQARTKKIYDRLEKADLQDLPMDVEPADLVAAADVFMYLGRLDHAVSGIARMLKPSGLFAFSVEKHDGPEEFVLRDTRRYAHSEAYLRPLLDRQGFAVRSMEPATLRQDRNEPVSGLIVVADRP